LPAREGIGSAIVNLQFSNESVKSRGQVPDGFQELDAAKENFTALRLSRLGE
jgi:hypothetical protein